MRGSLCIVRSAYTQVYAFENRVDAAVHNDMDTINPSTANRTRSYHHHKKVDSLRDHSFEAQISSTQTTTIKAQRKKHNTETKKNRRKARTGVSCICFMRLIQGI